jgi:hypothetical protein
VSVRTESTALGLISRLDFVSEHTNLGFIKLENTVNISDATFYTWYHHLLEGGESGLDWQNENLKYRCFIH